MESLLHGKTNQGAVLFDLDGTLTDPKVGITRSVQLALARFDILVQNPDELVTFIGPPLVESFQRYHGFDRVRAEQAVDVYREHYATVGLFENTLYPGVSALLEHLHNAGRSLVLATSKPTVFADRILAHFDLDRYFNLVVGSNLDHTRVTKGEVIRHVLTERPDLSALTPVMVGDREHDVLGARENEIEAIAVTYGYGSRDELLAVSPAYLADSVKDLARLLGLQPS